VNTSLKVLIGLGVGGAAAYFGYKAYREYKQEQENEAARQRIAAGGGVASGGLDVSGLMSLLPKDFKFSDLPWLGGEDKKKDTKAKAKAVFTAPATVAMTQPCALQSVNDAGKKKKLTAVQVDQLMPATLIWQGQQIAMPQDKGKSGTALQDAQQDLIDYAVSKGWLTPSPGAAGLPRWVVTGKKGAAKMARAKAAACAKTFIVYEAYQMAGALQPVAAAGGS
jgi:uncharacterized membrane protein YebE (DUF533 family)